MHLVLGTLNWHRALQYKHQHCVYHVGSLPPFCTKLLTSCYIADTRNQVCSKSVEHLVTKSTQNRDLDELQTKSLECYGLSGSAYASARYISAHKRTNIEKDNVSCWLVSMVPLLCLFSFGAVSGRMVSLVLSRFRTSANSATSGIIAPSAPICTRLCRTKFCPSP